MDTGARCSRTVVVIKLHEPPPFKGDMCQTWSERLDRTPVACLRQSGTVAINVAVYVSSLSEAHFKDIVKHFKKN